MSRKGKLGLLLMSVVVVALILSSCFLPQPKTPPTFSVSPTTITAYSGQSFNLSVSAQGANGISQIVATFQGSTVTKTSNPATFTFMAPNVIAQTQYPLGITVYGKNGLSVSATETVNVVPYTSVGSITYAVRLNNPYPYVYDYPAQNNNQSVIFTVNVGNGAGMVGGVSVYVDGKSIPASPTTLSSVLKATVAGTTFIVQKSFVALYSISLNHVGPHTFWVNFYGTSGALLGSSKSGYFYISYPGAQSVTLSAATPLYNTKYINGVSGNVSFTAKATDYTSQYEGFLINGTPFATYLNIATAVSVLGTTYPISVPPSALTSAGTTTFTFKDLSIDGNVASAARTYVVVKSAPVLKVTYNGASPVNNVLYVGISPAYFNVYAYDPYWMTSGATISSSFGKTPYNLNKNSTTPIDASFLSNGATATFSAYVENYADIVSSTSLTVYRISVGPKISYANVYGLKTINGTPDTTDGTITVVASVTMAFPTLGSVTWVLSGVATPAQYSLTRSATGLWVGTVNTANLLPGTYKSWISAEDVAQNVATGVTVPATVNVYRAVQDVFTTTLTTVPPTPVNGYVKSATLTANINPTWVYAIRKVVLYKEAPNTTTYASSSTKVGNAGSTYAFSITASGTYKIVTIDNANQRATQVESPWVVKIDNATPALKLNTSPSIASTSLTITVKATELNSGISSLLLEYQTLSSTGANNGGWVPIYATSTNNATVVSFTYKWNNLPPMDGEYNITLVGTSGVGLSASTSTTFINDKNGKPNVVFTPSATLVFTNKSTATASVKVLNESDVTVQFSYTRTSGTSTKSTVVSKSYTKIPFSAATTLTFSKQAPYTYKATVTDLAGLSATSQVVFVYDTEPASFSIKPSTGTIRSYGKVVAAAGTPVTFTIQATDNLSGIKSVVVNGQPATLKLPTESGKFGVILGATYTVVLNAPSYTSNATWTVTATVTDNAGNVATKILQIWIDAVAPQIKVSFYNSEKYLTPFNGYVYSSASPTVVATVYGYELTVKATYYANSNSGTPLTPKSASFPASWVSFTATYTNTLYKLTVVATDGLNKLSSSNTTSATVVIGSGKPTVQATLQTRSATIPYMLDGKNMNHYINLASSNTTYNATIIVKDPNSIPLKSAAFYLNGTAYPFISNGAFVSQPGLVVQSKQLTNGGITAATLTVNLNETPYVSQTGLYTLTVAATDFALNATSTITSKATSFYYDVTKPQLQPNKTLYKSGNYYYFDLGFSEQMATLTNKSVAASIVTFQFANGLTYTSNPGSQTFVPVTSYDTGLLHIWGLNTTSGASVNVLPLAGNTVTITVGASYVSAGGNPVSGPVTVTFENVSAPKPVNP